MRIFVSGGCKFYHGHRHSLENTETSYLLLFADTHQLHDAQTLPGGDGVVHRSERSLVDFHAILPPRFVGLLWEEGTGVCNLDSSALEYNIKFPEIPLKATIPKNVKLVSAFVPSRSIAILFYLYNFLHRRLIAKT